MRSSLLFCARVVACCAIFAAPPAFADKTDVVTLQNGDRLTGEVKTLERGLLTFKTDTMGTVQIEWDKVASLESRFLFDVELTSGQRHFGRLVHAPESGRLTIAQGDEAHSLELADTIRISQMDTAGALRDLVDGSVSFGFTYSDSTSISQLTLGADLSRRNAVRLWDFNLDVTESDAPGTDRQGAATLSGETRRFFDNRWFSSGLGMLQRNDQLGLDRRALVGGGGGRYLVQTSDREVAVLAGVAGSLEKFVDGQTSESIELILGGGYDAFRFDTPELRLSASLVAFPSLTISGRFRTMASLELRYELVKDLFAQIALTHAYDSRPQSVGAAESDYTLTTSVGYSF